MNGGSQFVETLKKLNYPKASKLNGDDFDWLFETVKDRSFLHWFCSTVNKQNLLSEEEVKAFKALKESGKPILDEDALGEVLKTCQSTESKESALLEELDLEKLEEELQALKKTKNLKIQRRNKLQMMGTTSRNASLRLTGEEQEAAKGLKGTMEMLGAENAKINSELQSLVEEVKQLTVFFTTKSKRASLSRPPAFLSQLVLDRYLQLEEQNTKTLAAYTKKQFFEGISDLVESSNEENFQLLDISGNLISRESNQAPEGQREEMARLQFAYIASQYQLIQRKSKEQSVRAGLQWMKENQHSLLRSKLSGDEDDLQARGMRLKKELEIVEQQVEVLSRERLPAVVRENAQLLNMPVVKGDFDLQIARQEYYTSRQDEVCSQLLQQKASFELLLLAYEMELRKYRQFHRQLGDITKELEESRRGLAQRLEAFSDPSLSRTVKQRSIIDSKDSSFHRLYQMLEGETGKEQLFRTYEGLEQAAQKLCQDVALVKERLAASSQEQSLLTVKMESESDVLRNTNYCGLKQLMLTPQVCLTKQEHFLNSQELGETILQLESQLNTLNQLMVEILNDVKGKKKILERNKLQQMERDLYLYFFQDEDCLKSIVEELEKKVSALSIGQGD
ncbi:HAUS augmin-like complex subunit 3 isoform X1 [Acipenser ruthenus]|uniref:HAUS augmin-like complex subunit 3 isoform X1 n=1 Tax=Acipenser ruthenus TaxID=7906 RepID=UPI002740E152|nr:HAUS augmin-like complex subunit 3 isoform X1 [Acipenser ruthenus]XP_033889999.2 HAUS augmin-like complex subunit 3 isoform X1 [Acipenser ruthenus]XP_058890455.1 HAUS augmin-like complex subunit 3 isoform X1 [Acipenser ruthenus]